MQIALAASLLMISALAYGRSLKDSRSLRFVAWTKDAAGGNKDKEVVNDFGSHNVYDDDSLFINKDMRKPEKIQELIANKIKRGIRAGQSQQSNTRGETKDIWNYIGDLATSGLKSSFKDKDTTEMKGIKKLMTKVRHGMKAASLQHSDMKEERKYSLSDLQDLSVNDEIPGFKGEDAMEPTKIQELITNKIKRRIKAGQSQHSNTKGETKDFWNYIGDLATSGVRSSLKDKGVIKRRGKQKLRANKVERGMKASVSDQSDLKNKRKYSSRGLGDLTASDGRSGFNDKDASESMIQDLSESKTELGIKADPPRPSDVNNRILEDLRNLDEEATTATRVQPFFAEGAMDEIKPGIAKKRAVWDDLGPLTPNIPKSGTKGVFQGALRDDVNMAGHPDRQFSDEDELDILAHTLHI